MTSEIDLTRQAKKWKKKKKTTDRWTDRDRDRERTRKTPSSSFYVTNL